MLPRMLLTLAAGVTGLLTVAALWFGPERVVSRTVMVAEPPDVVWQILTDLDNLPTWRRGLTRVERLPDQGGRPAWMEYRGELREAVQVAEAERPLRLVTERLNSEGVAASWRWELSRTAEGSRLTLTRRLSMPSVAQRIISGVLRRPNRELRQTLADLSLRLEGRARVRTTALNR